MTRTKNQRKATNNHSLAGDSNGVKKCGNILQNLKLHRFVINRLFYLSSRSILNQVVYLKAECFNWSKLRKETAAEYLLRFLDSEIRLLWPKGWMTAKILFKESQEAHSFVT